MTRFIEFIKVQESKFSSNLYSLITLPIFRHKEMSTLQIQIHFKIKCLEFESICYLIFLMAELKDFIL